MRNPYSNKSRLASAIALCTSFLLAIPLLAAVRDSEASSQKGARLVALAKAATGGKAWDEIDVWHEVGHSISSSGRASRYEHWQDFHSLAVRNVGGSELDHMIFDGHVAYGCRNPQCDPPTKFDSASMKIGAYLTSFGFFFPNRFAASFRYEGSRRERGILFDVVKVSPAGLDSVDIWIDHGTHLIFRLAYGGGQIHDDLSDYRVVGSLTVPFTTTGSGAVIKADSVQFEPAGTVSFSLPK